MSTVAASPPLASPVRPALGYVEEIDGLRAVAVLSVLLFHVQYPWIPGGFVGVDVFFVISGFLISRIILAELDAGRFSIARFYERRIRRIAPALIATLAGCLVFLVLLPGTEALAIRNAIFAALLSGSNFWFHATTDYFRDNQFNPLLHTWSLSVEEQFYVALPPLLWFATRQFGRHRIGVIVLALVVSCGLSERVVRSDPSAAFYLPWLRAWELLAGTLLASVDLSRLSRPLRVLLSHLGLAAILGACLGFSGAMRFPGFSAWLPVLGAGAVIAGVGARSPANALLAMAPMRVIGRISYSLYLVHWPIVCLVATLYGLTPKARLGIVAVSVALAWLSWRFVETPFRQPRGDAAGRRAAFRGFAAAVAGVALTATGVTIAGRLLWQRFPTAVAYAGYLDGMREEFERNACWVPGDSIDFPAFAAGECLRLDPARRNVLLIGDSHAAHLVRALRAEYPEVRVLHAARGNCRPFANQDARRDPVCDTLMHTLYADWLPEHARALDAVILSARWRREDAADLAAAVRQLDGLGMKAIVLGPSPEFRAMLPLTLAYDAILSTDFSAKLVKDESFQLDAALAADPVIAPHYRSLMAPLCPARTCVLDNGREAYYYDRDHLTLPGARLALHALLP